jgi:hypothetical protein
LRGIVRKKAGENLVRDPPERVVAMRIPDIEEIMSTGRENTMDFAIGFVLVGIEHHAELAHHDIEAGVAKRQRRRIRRLKADLLCRFELRSCDLQHRRAEVGRGELCHRRQMIAKTARHDAGPCGSLEHTPGIERGGAARDVVGVIDEYHRPEPGVVMLGNAAGKTRRIPLHLLSR